MIAGAAFTVRFLRNGDQIFLYRNILDSNGNGAALFQVVNSTSGVVAPDWTIEKNQPIIQIGVRSSVGFPVTIQGVKWNYDGHDLNFVLNGSEWVTAENSSKFMARINGMYHELKIVDNIASVDAIANKQITYDVTYVSNGITDTIKSSVDVLIQSAGSDSHIVQITTDRVELDKDNTTATLTAVGYYGTNPITIGQNGYTIKWFMGETELQGQTSSILKVTRDMVEGGSIFIVKLYLNGKAVAQDSQRINDIADEYQVRYAPTYAGSNCVSISNNASYTLSLYKNNRLVSGSVSFSWVIYDSTGKNKATGTGNPVTIKPEHCKVGDGEDSYYSDCDVLATAEF